VDIDPFDSHHFTPDPDPSHPIAFAVCSLLQEAVEYATYEQLEADYLSGKIHPGDLKPAVADALNKILEPVRQHFASGEPKALLEKIKKFKVTR